MLYIKSLRITHSNNSNLINKRFNKFINQKNKDFCDDVWGLIKEYAIDSIYINSDYYKVFLRELYYKGYMWKGVKNNWEWEDYHYKVFKNEYNRDVFVKYWNNCEMNEYVKLRPPSYTGEIDNRKSKLLGDWDIMVFPEEWKNRRYRCNYYLECKTPYKSISQSEMKQINDKHKDWDNQSWAEYRKQSKQFKIKVNKDRYTEIRNKINKTIRYARKNKDWGKSINVYDIYDEDWAHFYTAQQRHNFLFGKRVGHFIWVKTEEWKIYKIYERWIEYKPKTRQIHGKNNDYDKAYLRLKKVEEYIIPMRDVNTHHKSYEYKRNKVLIKSIMDGELY